MSKTFKRTLGTERTSGAKFLDNLAKALGQRTAGLSNAKTVMESLYDPNVTDEQANEDYNQVEKNTTDALDSALKETGMDGEYTPEQKQAGAQAMVLAANPQAVWDAQAKEKIDGDTVLAEGDLGSHVMEAFSNQDISSTQVFSAKFNMQTTRQGDFSQKFFPIHIMSATERSISIEATLFSVLGKNFRHTQDGKSNLQNEKLNVLRALRYHTILENKSTELIPVYVAGTNDDVFIDPSLIAPSTVKHDGVEFETNWIKTGKEINSYIGICSTPADLKEGEHDRSSVLDAKLTISALLLQVGDDLIPFRNLDVQGGTDHLPQANENAKQMVLNRSFQGMQLNANTKKHNNDDLTTLADIKTNDLRVMFRFKFNSMIDTESSSWSTSVGEVVVSEIYNAENQSLSLTDGIGATIVEKMKDAKIIGTQLKARLLNDNLRKQGQEVEVDVYRINYRVPVLSPFNATRVSNLVNTGVNDTDRLLSALSGVVHISMENDAVTKVIEFSELLSQASQVPDPTKLYGNQRFGVSQFLVSLWYNHLELDMNTVQSLSDSDRISDISARMVNALRHEVFTAYRDSNFQAVRQILHGNTENKPVVVLGGDANIINYFQLHGDLRTLSDNFSIDMAASTDIRLTDTLFWVFGAEKGKSSDMSNPLHFGNTFWCPEVVTDLDPQQRGVTVVKKLYVHPSYLRVMHTPIMGKITVKGMSEAVKSYLTLRTKEQP